MMGFDYIYERLTDQNEWCSISYVSTYINVLGSCAPFLYEPFAKIYVPKIVDVVIKNILESPEANIRNFNKDRINSI